MSKLAGRHLIIDATLLPESLPIVSSVEKMSFYLEEVTRITGMTLVFPPIAVKFPFASETHRLIEQLDKEKVTSPTIHRFKQHIKQRDTQGSGVSAISMWLESHCTLHSWPEENYISIDLFSCKSYDADYVLEFTKQYMRFRSADALIVDRFMNAPAKIKPVTVKEST